MIMMEHVPKIIRKTSPYLRRPQAKVSRMMSDVIIALLPLTIFAIYSFGWSAVFVLLASVLSMVGTEYIYYQVVDKLKGETFKWKNKSFTLYNFSAFTSGLIYGLTLPDQTAIWVVVVNGALGLFLAKLIFGGLGQNIFNPAAVARVLLVVNYAANVALVSYGEHVDAVAGATALQMTANDVFGRGVLDTYPLMDLFTGIGIPGSIGEVSTLLIVVGAIYLAFRASFEVRIPITYVLTVFGLASAVAIYKDLGLWYPMYHVFSGGLLFGAVFMATDPITSPITKPGRIYFGFGLGVLTFVIRLFGAYPEGVIFSILILNMFVPTFDYFKWSNPKFSKRQYYIFAGVVLLSIVVVLVGASYVG